MELEALIKLKWGYLLYCNAACYSCSYKSLVVWFVWHL